MIKDILLFPRLYGAALRRAVVQRSSQEALTAVREKQVRAHCKFQRSARRTSKHQYLGSEQTVYYTVDVEVKCGHAVQLCAQLCTSTQEQIESLRHSSHTLASVATMAVAAAVANMVVDLSLQSRKLSGSHCRCAGGR